MKVPHLINFLLIVLLFDSILSFDDLINQTCNRAEHNDPNVHYHFCVSCLEANPRSQHASLEELVFISIEISLSNATVIMSNVSHMLDHKEDMDNHTIGALRDCMKLYSDAKSRLHEVVLDLKGGNKFKANLDASTVMDSSTTCEDGLKEKEGDVSPLSKENSVFFELIAMVLSFINML